MKTNPLKHTAQVLSALLLCLAPLALQAKARDQLTVFTRSLKGLETRFEQSVTEANGKISERSRGSMKLSAPRQLAWTYDGKDGQRIVADGDRVWIYDPGLEQVTVRQQGLEEQTSPLAILLDPAQLERQFKVSEGGMSQGLEWLVLAPRKKDDGGFERIRLGFMKNALARMELTDAFGRKTALTFAGWKRNPTFARNTFRFVPPKGVDVVGDAGQGAEVKPLRD